MELPYFSWGAADWRMYIEMIYIPSSTSIFIEMISWTRSSKNLPTMIAKYLDTKIIMMK